MTSGIVPNCVLAIPYCDVEFMETFAIIDLPVEDVMPAGTSITAFSPASRFIPSVGEDPGLQKPEFWPAMEMPVSLIGVGPWFCTVIT